MEGWLGKWAREVRLAWAIVPTADVGGEVGGGGGEVGKVGKGRDKKWDCTVFMIVV